MWYRTSVLGRDNEAHLIFEIKYGVCMCAGEGIYTREFSVTDMFKINPF